MQLKHDDAAHVHEEVFSIRTSLKLMGRTNFKEIF